MDLPPPDHAVSVLLVANGYPPSAYGGVESYTRQIASSLAGRGHAVHVFCREADGARSDHEIIRDHVEGIPVIRVVNDFKGISHFRDTFLDAKIAEHFRRLLEEVQPEIVHFNHWIALSADLSRITSVLGIPSVATFHDFWPLCHRVHLRDWKGRRCPGPVRGGDCYQCVVGSAKLRAWARRFLRWGKRSTLGRLKRQARRAFVRDPHSVMALTGSRQDFDDRYQVFKTSLQAIMKFLVPSEFVAAFYRANHYTQARFEVLPLGVASMEMSGFTPEFPAPITLGFVGTVIPGKGLHVLLDALKRVQSERLRVLVFGRMDADPVYTRSIQRHARKDGRVSLRGPFSPNDRLHVYREIDVLVHPSLVPETFSLVAREGLLSGKPVIASEVGALPEIITEGVNGYLVPPDDVGSLANLLANIAQDPKRLQALELPGPTPILSVDDHTSHLERIYRSLI